MNVSGIFKILIIVVACIIVGGILLNVLLPNGLNGILGWMESGIMAATGAEHLLLSSSRLVTVLTVLALRVITTVSSSKQLTLSVR